MSCESVQERVSLFLDSMLIEGEQAEIAVHLKSCTRCQAHLQSFTKMRAALRSLDRPPIPAVVAMQLRVLASHERMRQLSRASLPSRLRYWTERMELLFENLMRPVALPFAGGVLSAMLLFGMLVPNLSFVHNFRDDLLLATSSDPEGRLVESLPSDGSPTWWWTGTSPEPRLGSVSASGAPDETVLELIIDETGRVADYSVSNNGPLTPEMQSIILFSRFTPATLNGRTTWGKMFVTFHRGRKIRG
jgi:hypothetical protein